MDFNNFEFSVEQKPLGVWLFLRIAMIVFYVLFVILYFGVIFVTRMIPLGAFIPLFVWMLVFFTWKYVTPEYKYTIISGVLTFYKVFGKKEHKQVSFKLSCAKSIAPVSQNQKSSAKSVRVKRYSALPQKNSSEGFIISFTDTDGNDGEIALILPEGAIKVLRFYNSSLASKISHGTDI